MTGRLEIIFIKRVMKSRCGGGAYGEVIKGGRIVVNDEVEWET